MSDLQNESALPLQSESACDQHLSSYDYLLPEELIAQNPVVPRDSSRLLVVHPDCHEHRSFRDLPGLLRPGDCLVLNNTRVIPARLYGHKCHPVSGQPGAPVELLLLEEVAANQWHALVKPGRRLGVGSRLVCGSAPGPVVGAKVLATLPEIGGRLIEFDLPPGESLWSRLDQLGQVPLPPYVTQSQATPEQYQTVYAERLGAVAAPTAGLHFTPELLESLRLKGIQHGFITLHVGVGTFRPVEVDDVRSHKMHSEWIEVGQPTVDLIAQTRRAGGRVIAVGTTVARALESAAQAGSLQPYQGKTNLFIYPGYRWQVLDGLITNFHLPRSSLLMLVSALISRERLLQLYTEAIQQRYRFYSFGDAMLIL
ncbi:tRNA preQ1(34) S-adenosylmethionine ribosyltransferase-isomerase QueA [Leptolyngbya sp. FACHB-261]|uniref:tRNA preQ1(34) S-adenosylmethionine ribosyltransferase-isomerase QueA n=1 Tax=Leptolyngbya sp. FACHB-261 TaxID=2692806 RepID=UPI001685E619|nr:tRNA preQ1(34) S-adenosylmethionine ribosyltransferase-isomerase QueA [Leptolyngbya sp. FACHB-261]MBD2102249.1 tRNA preQ1(34) S-adenosylmethionine ribosyltransferase-isomerase QueA [Leptolyngbya sp. FACHB-261]